MLRGFLRHILVWWLPFIVGLIVLLAAFLGWALGTQAGARFILGTAASQLDGEVSGIEGSVLNGLSVDKLRLALPGLDLDTEGLRLQVEWKALSQRTVHVRELSLDVLRVGLTSSPDDEKEEDDSASGDPITLPVNVVIDRLALGHFELMQDGEPLPVELGGLEARARLDDAGLDVELDSLSAAHELAKVQLNGTAHLGQLGTPWPMKVALAAAIEGSSPDSPLCDLRDVPGVVDLGEDEICAFQAKLDVDGSLEGMEVALQADGSGLALRAGADVAALDAIPVRHADVVVTLANGSGLDASVDLEPVGEAGSGRERLSGRLSATNLDAGALAAGALAAGAIPPAILTVAGTFGVELIDRSALANADLTLDIAEGSSWNEQPLAGTMAVRVAGAERPDGTEDGVTTDWTRLRVTRLDTDLKLGGNTVHTEGSFGDPQAELKLDVQAMRLAHFWPDLPGGVTAKGRVGGAVPQHDAELEVRYAPGDAKAKAVGEAPIDLRVSLAGGWRNAAPADGEAAAPTGNGNGSEPTAESALAGWRGQLRALNVTHAGIEVAVPQPISASFLPDAQAPLWQYSVGAGEVAINLPGKHVIRIAHRGSRGGPGRWQTAGGIDNLVISPTLIRDVRKLIDPEFKEQAQEGGVKVVSPGPSLDRHIGLDLDWDFRFDGALAGTARVARRSGDLTIPGDPPVALGLQELTVDLKATPTGGGASRLDAAVVAGTEKMGHLNGTASAVLQAQPGGGMALAPRQPIRASLNADIDDLGWIVLFTGDSLDVGGSLHANVEGQGTLDGEWTSSGTVTGENLRVVRIDDGVRLLDGTLSLKLDNDRVILESLRFPAVQRVMPNEWRTRTWITETPEAQNGELRASGAWDLASSEGDVSVVLDHFPILQRADRYAMMSGQVDIKAALPSLRITGKVTADAGWVSVEMMSSVPTVDDDVVVRTADTEEVDVPEGMDVGMDITVDLGPRFYLTGMGIDSGLVGSLQILLDDGQLTGMGAFRTRGGRFEAYGQRLHLRRGVITFQENIANPLLDIEALRLGEQVEAGVRVGGTAQRPRIDLVSYPDVSDVDKLSWLILGRGADQSGNDAALLLALGASLIGGDGPPFYRRLGLDDVGIKSGAMGSSGSLLPDTTVASSVTRDSSADLETQFMYASKTFANGVTLSIEQALAGAETVGRASYRLARGLSLDLKGGSVNGLELVYRRLWGNER